jgi:hypothetical protein
VPGTKSEAYSELKSVGGLSPPEDSKSVAAPEMVKLPEGGNLLEVKSEGAIGNATNLSDNKEVSADN